MKNGWTLLELLIVLAISSIFLFFSTHFTSIIYKKNQLECLVTDLQQALNYARMMSLSQGEDLRLVAEKGGWSCGMRLLNENNHQPIREWHWSRHRLQMSWHGFQSKDYLRFSPDLQHSAINGYFLITDGGQKTMRLVMNRIGRVRREPL